MCKLDDTRYLELNQKKEKDFSEKLGSFVTVVGIAFLAYAYFVIVNL